jgi:ubiquinone/menaquinone biosynthesis C-methylase UbiE
MTASVSKGFKGIGMEGRLAHWYARTRGKDMEQFRQSARQVAQSLPLGSRVLEVAPGPGFFSIELAKLGKFQITGLDVSRTMVEIAQENTKKAGVSVAFLQGNASAMAFPDDSFDFIYCSAAFKNFSEPVKALDEMYRVLRPGGAAVIADLCKDTPRETIDLYIEQSGRGWFDGWMTKLAFRFLLLKRAYTRGDFTRMAGESRFGACEIQAESIGFEVRFRKPEQAQRGAA